MKNDLCDSLLKFTVDVKLYLRTMKNTIETMGMKRQSIKAASSSVANYEESQGISHKTRFQDKSRYITKRNA